MIIDNTIDVVSALIRKDREIMVVRRSNKTKHFSEMLSFPGGKREEGESVFQTIKREVLKETGYRVKPINSSLILIGKEKDKEGGIRFYLVECIIDKFVSKPSDLYVTETLFVKPEILLKSLRDNNFYKDQINKTKKILLD